MSTDVEIKEQLSDDKRTIFVINIKDKKALYRLYMPFVANGGLFVYTESKYNLNDEVYLLLTLPEDPEKYTISGKVVWLTPACAQGGRTAGVGIQFVSEESLHIRNKVEALLVSLMKNGDYTDTF